MRETQFKDGGQTGGTSIRGLRSPPEGGRVLRHRVTPFSRGSGCLAAIFPGHLIFFRCFQTARILGRPFSCEICGVGSGLQHRGPKCIRSFQIASLQQMAAFVQPISAKIDLVRSSARKTRKSILLQNCLHRNWAKKTFHQW